MRRAEAAGSDPCRRCAHYFVTWDAARPHGCRAMGFKSRQLPCRVVLESSAADCRAFEPKRNAPPDPTIPG